MNLEDLKKPFPIDKISWRVGRKRKDGKAATALSYIDARDLYERLDEVCGAGNWQLRYPQADSKTTCEIGIRVGDEWIWKANGAGDSNIEGEKGAYSDAAKRAGVPWGIAAYLYDTPEIWIDIDEWGKFKNPNDPKFEGALKKAQAGVGVIKETPEQKWLSDARAAISKIEDITEVGVWLEENKATINELSDDQVNWINGIAAKQRGVLESTQQVNDELDNQAKDKMK